MTSSSDLSSAHLTINYEIAGSTLRVLKMLQFFVWNETKLTDHRDKYCSLHA